MALPYAVFPTKSRRQLPLGDPVVLDGKGLFRADLPENIAFDGGLATPASPPVDHTPVGLLVDRQVIKDEPGAILLTVKFSNF